jgi:putative polyhydroxyalkanoic acid system protein
MQVKIPHQFSQAQAKERVMRALNEARQKIGEQATIEKEEWQGETLHFSFTAQGQSISGTFEVREGEFELNATLPLMLRMFEGQIKKAIEEQAGTMLK